MFRRLFTLLSALSLLLFVAAVVMWARSGFVADYVERVSVRQPPNPVWTRVLIASGKGVLSLRHDHWQYVYRGNDPRRGEYQVPKVGVVAPEENWLGYFTPQGTSHSSSETSRWPHPFDKDESRAGFFWKTERVGDTDVRPDFWIIGERWQGAIPYWFAAAAFSLMPAVALHRATRNLRQRRLARIGLRPSCGYDLRATPGRCPECGTVPAANKA